MPSSCASFKELIQKKRLDDSAKSLQDLAKDFENDSDTSVGSCLDSTEKITSLEDFSSASPAVDYGYRDAAPDVAEKCRESSGMNKWIKSLNSLRDSSPVAPRRPSRTRPATRSSFTGTGGDSIQRPHRRLSMPEVSATIPTTKTSRTIIRTTRRMSLSERLRARRRSSMGNSSEQQESTASSISNHPSRVPTPPRPRESSSRRGSLTLEEATRKDPLPQHGTNPCPRKPRPSSRRSSISSSPRETAKDKNDKRLIGYFEDMITAYYEACHTSAPSLGEEVEKFREKQKSKQVSFMCPCPNCGGHAGETKSDIVQLAIQWIKENSNHKS